jgi:endonuclease YncB( thermonuclease family)
VSTGTPQCDYVKKDTCGRTVAVCRVNGRDIGEAMVRSGMAYAANSERYRPVDQQARFDRLGIHAQRCASPTAWRTSHSR